MKNTKPYGFPKGTKTKAALTASLLGAFALTANAAIIFTESFETPSVTGSTGAGNVTVSTTTFDNAVTISDNGGFAGGANPDGAFARVADGNSGGLDTAAQAGDQYLIVGVGGAQDLRAVWTVSAANTLTGGSVGEVSYFRASMFDDGNSAWTVTLSGAAVATHSLSSTDGEGLDTWFEETLAFTVTDPTQALVLTLTDDTIDAQHSIEDFAIDNITVTAIPEPSSTALIGLGGLSLLFRRRK